MKRAGVGAALAGLLAACAGATGGGTGEAPGRGPTGYEPGRDDAPARGGGVLYRAMPSTRYAVERRDSLILELPGAPQYQSFDRTAYLTVSVAENGEKLQAAITLDSTRAAAGSMIPRDSLRAADGTRWAAELSPTGQLTWLSASDTSTVGEQLRSMLPLLFPPVPEDGAREGAAWTDTTETKLQVNAFAATEEATLDYRAVGTGTRDGQRALEVRATGTFKQKGAGSPFGQVLEMQAAGQRRATFWLGIDGALVAATGSDSSGMTITVPAVGQSVPAKQYSSYTITALSKGSR